MRHLLCAKCAGPFVAGTRTLYPRSPIGDPAEIQRLTLGFAKTPTREQRWRAVNGIREYLPLTHYNCDSCFAKIVPGDPAAARSVWLETQQPIPEWENEYLERTKQ